MQHILGIVFRTGAPYTGDCFLDGCTLKLTGARAPGAPMLTEALHVILFCHHHKILKVFSDVSISFFGT